MRKAKISPNFCPLLFTVRRALYRILPLYLPIALSNRLAQPGQRCIALKRPDSCIYCASQLLPVDVVADFSHTLVPTEWNR